MVVAAFTGNYIGIVVSLPVSGILAQTWGWESVFYVFGVVGCIWTALWLMFVRKSPGTDPYITDTERRYIENSLNRQTKDKDVPIPWKAIWTSTAVWAIIAAQFSEGWGFFTLQTQLPQFLKDVLNFDLAKSGFISAIPYLSMSFMLQVSGYLADWVRIKGYWTTGQTRRYFNCLAFIAQTVCMMLAAWFLHPATSVTFITIGVALASFAYSSFSVNYLGKCQALKLFLYLLTVDFNCLLVYRHCTTIRWRVDGHLQQFRYSRGHRESDSDWIYRYNAGKFI